MEERVSLPGSDPNPTSREVSWVEAETNMTGKETWKP
jgi:hypothetical protein